MVTAARPAGSDSAGSVDSTAAVPGVDASSGVDSDPAAASAGGLRTSGTADSGTGLTRGVLPPPPAMAAAAAVSTPLSSVGGSAAGAAGAGAAGHHAQATARPALSPVGEDEEEEETVPLGHNPLARRVLVTYVMLRIIVVIWNVST